MSTGCTSDARRMHVGCTSDARRMHVGCTSDARRMHVGCRPDAKPRSAADRMPPWFRTHRSTTISPAGLL
jgi:hypothetical protein